MRPEAKGELVAVSPLYDDSPVKDGLFSLSSRLVYGTGHRLTSRDMMDIADGASLVDVRTGETQRSDQHACDRSAARRQPPEAGRKPAKEGIV